MSRSPNVLRDRRERAEAQPNQLEGSRGERKTVSQNWVCYFHEGPCKLLRNIGAYSLEQHGNSCFRWWEIWDKINLKTRTFWKKKDAVTLFESLLEGAAE